jgi:hypothetical protein
LSPGRMVLSFFHCLPGTPVSAKDWTKAVTHGDG